MPLNPNRMDVLKYIIALIVDCAKDDEDFLEIWKELHYVFLSIVKPLGDKLINSVFCYYFSLITLFIIIINFFVVFKISYFSHFKK